VDVRERGDSIVLVVSYTDEPCGGCKREVIRWYSSYLIQTSHAVDARVKGDLMVPVVSNTDELLPVVDSDVTVSGGCKRETNTKSYSSYRR
jgi:hypothetical protein